VAGICYVRKKCAGCGKVRKMKEDVKYCSKFCLSKFRHRHARKIARKGLFAAITRAKSNRFVLWS